MQITWGHKHIKMFSIQCLTNVVDNLPQQNKNKYFRSLSKSCLKLQKIIHEAKLDSYFIP